MRVRLLGKCLLEDEATGNVELTCAKARELLGYLACHRQRVLSREMVIGALWGDLQEEQGKRALRQTLWQLQESITPFQISASRPFIESVNGWIRLNPDSGIWLDVARFEDLSKRSRFTPGQSINQQQADNLTEAVGIYRGHLLEDCFKDWCLRERDRLRDIYYRTLLQLMEHQRVTGDHQAALATAELVLREEPASEKAHWTIMWLHLQMGDRISALRQYQRCREALRRELDILPSSKLVNLRHEIRKYVGSEADNADKIIESDAADATMLDLLRQMHREIIALKDELKRLESKMERDVCSDRRNKDDGQIQNRF